MELESRSNDTRHSALSSSVCLWFAGKEDAHREAFSPCDSQLVQPNGNLSSWNVGENHLIVGNNLDALKLLRQSPDARFRFVYIDPPYNTGKNFTFSDKWKAPASSEMCDESQWLSHIYPRLLLCREVMADDGVLFISIDESEIAALKLIVCEIFGKEHFLGTLKWRRKRKPSFLDKKLANTMEYILVVCKDQRQFTGLLGGQISETTRPVLNAENQRSMRWIRKGTQASCCDGIYQKGSYTTRTLEFELLESLEIRGSKVVHDTPVKGPFRVSQHILDQTLFITKNFGLRRRLLPTEQKRRVATDLLLDWPTNEDAELEQRELFGTKIFDFPKPVGLIQGLLAMCQWNSGPVHCLDFYAGTGTLAEAVLGLAPQSSNQAYFYTCVQLPEKFSSPKVFGLNTIADLMVYRAELVHKKLGISMHPRVLRVQTRKT